MRETYKSGDDQFSRGKLYVYAFRNTICIITSTNLLTFLLVCVAFERRIRFHFSYNIYLNSPSYMTFNVEKKVNVD